MKRINSLFYFLVLFLLFGIIFKILYFQRPFFRQQDEEKKLYNGNYFKVSRFPSLKFPFINAYYYETNIYGGGYFSENDFPYSGHIIERDSVFNMIIYDENFKIEERRFLNLKFFSDTINSGVYPSIERITRSWFELLFLLPSHDTASYRGLKLRITYDKGLDSIIPIIKN